MISIVVPALNEGGFLPKCLESLKNQDYKGKYEIIVVDDGSTDDTAEVSKKFGVKVVHCPKKENRYGKKLTHAQKITYARQRGADAASGGIILQADADTIYPSGWLRKLSERFSSNPEIVAVTGKFVYRNPPWWAKIEYFLRNYINILSLMVLGKPLLTSGANFAFRREAFLKVGGYNIDSLSPDQYGMAARLSRAGRIVYDKDISVSTSSRRVEKPFLFILVDMIANLINAQSYFFRSCLSSIRATVIKIPSFRTYLKLLPFAFIIGFFAYGYFVPTSIVFGKVYYKGNSSGKEIALTFDDGPNEPYTSQILGILDKYDVKATFFVVGKNVEMHPETTRRIIADGNVIGDHSYSHNANHALTSKGCRDINIAQETILNITGVEPHFYRPPNGKKSPWELECLKKENLIEITWSAYTNELHSRLIFGKPSPELVAKNIISKAHSGKIILLHDGYGTEHNTTRSDKSLTVKALPVIIEALQNEGYKFVTVQELLGIPAYNRA